MGAALAASAMETKDTKPLIASIALGSLLLMQPRPHTLKRDVAAMALTVKRDFEVGTSQLPNHLQPLFAEAVAGSNVAKPTESSAVDNSVRNFLRRRRDSQQQRLLSSRGFGGRRWVPLET